MIKFALAPLAAIVLLAACSDNSTDEQTSSSATAAPDMQLPVVADDAPAFLPKDMAWMPKDIWLPEDFQPRWSQKLSPVAESYVLGGITQLSAAKLAEVISANMKAANYQPFETPKPQPGRLMFRGNGHGMIVFTVSEAGTGRQLTISVENASGQ